MGDQVISSNMAGSGSEHPAAGQVNISRWLSEAWNLVMSDFANFMLLSIIYIVLMGIASWTFLGGLIFGGPLTAGFFYIVFQKIRGNPINIGDIAKGFNFFVAALLADILITVFVAIGLFFLIIPGIVISALYMFAFPLIIEKNMDFWQAMETSRKIIQKNIFEYSAFMLLLYVLLLLGLLMLLVGFVFALPLTFVAIGLAYRDMVGLDEKTI
ncbi:MAG: hypothetical protein ONB16_03675 [candidate division KSB1 bacterium]|nr:hypothetical protein [candidate division KSB1 bacterium]MDZ7340108.1 hypothetical protein [candidate division KSB1 bacterium]